MLMTWLVICIYSSTVYIRRYATHYGIRSRQRGACWYGRYVSLPLARAFSHQRMPLSRTFPVYVGVCEWMMAFMCVRAHARTRALVRSFLCLSVTGDKGLTKV